MHTLDAKSHDPLSGLSVKKSNDPLSGRRQEAERSPTHTRVQPFHTETHVSMVSSDAACTFHRFRTTVCTNG